MSALANPQAGATGHRRLNKEFRELVATPPVGISLNTGKIESEGGGRLDTWFVDIAGPEETLYAGEKFELQLKFGRQFPFESPEVTFIGPNIPIHPHVYSNGHICLSILADDWTPALSVVSICLSIQSMLSTCTEKRRPRDDEDYVQSQHGQSPKDTSWHFHDDDV